MGVRSTRFARARHLGRAGESHPVELRIDIPPAGSTQDLTVKAVAKETGRAPSTVRDWLISGALCGCKLNGRDWRVSRDSLREYLHAQSTPSDRETEGEVGKGARA